MALTEEMAAQTLLSPKAIKNGKARKEAVPGAQSGVSKAAAVWVGQQMALPPTHHRAYFRERINPRLDVTLRGMTPLWSWPRSAYIGHTEPDVARPCDADSVWRRYALTLEDRWARVTVRLRNHICNHICNHIGGRGSRRVCATCGARTSSVTTPVTTSLLIAPHRYSSHLIATHRGPLPRSPALALPSNATTHLLDISSTSPLHLL